MNDYEDLKAIVEANQTYNLTEHSELHDAIAYEKSQRIAGDAVLQVSIDTVNTRVTNVDSSLSEEVINRTLADQVSDGLYAGLSTRFINEWQDLNSQLSDLSIDTATSVNNLNNSVAALALRVTLVETTLRQETKDLIAQYDGKLAELDSRVAKYELMLQDITTDNAQITSDNGEIIFGAWTILSRAREWDLEIIRDLKKYKLDTTGDLNQALEDIQNQLPNADEIINQALEELANAPVIVELDRLLGQSLTDINSLNDKLNQQAIETATNMINLSNQMTAEINRKTDELASTLVTETTDRVDAIARETSTRLAQIQLLDDGLTQEINDRIDGDAHTIQLIDNLKVSNDADFANIRSELTVTTSKANANAVAITALDARVVVNEGKANEALVNAATATQKAETAISATTALASRVTTVETSLLGKVDNTAFQSLESKVTSVEGNVTTNTASITGLQSRMTSAENNITTNANAVSQLQIKNTEQDGKLTQLTSDTTVLKNDMVTVKADLTTKATTQAVSNLQSEVTQQGDQIDAVVQSTTTLQANLNNMTIGGDNLLSNGNFAGTPDWNGWYIWGNATRSFESLNGKRYARLVSTDTTYFKGISQGALTPFLPDTEFTVSFLAYTLSASPQKIQMLVHQAGGGNNDPQINMATPNITALPKRYSLTFKSTSLASKSAFNFYIGGGFGTAFDVCVSDLQFEIGNKATSWKPSNKELTNSIAAGVSVTSALQAQVTGIDGRVTTNTTSITNLTGRVTNTETNITANTNALNTLQGTVTSQGNQLTANTGAITAVETSLGNAANATNNLAINSNVVGTYNGVSYPHVSYALNEACVVGQQYTLLWCCEHARGAGDTNSTLSAYIGGGQQVVDGTGDGTNGKVVRKITFIKANNANAPVINFYCINKPTADKGTVATVYWAVLVKGPTILGNEWFPGSYELKPTVEGHTSAISTLNTNMSTLDGRVTAASEASTRVEAKLADGINTRNYLLGSATGGTKTVLTAAMSKLLYSGTVISMAFDIDITSPVSAGSRNRIGYETSFNLAAGTYYCGVWLNNAASQGVGKYRIKNQFTIPAGWTNGASVFPSSFPYINQTSGGAFTISNVSMTVSAVPVGWMPAPEDASDPISKLETLTTITDTRNDNFAPSYYRTNFANKIVKEFKSATTLGISAPYSYVTLTTVVQWHDATGGPVTQYVEFDDNSRNLYRKSQGSPEVWSAWENKVVTDLNSKASASALNTLQTQVTNIDGRVTSTSSSLTQLQTTVDGHTSTLAVQGNSINGIQAEYTIKTDVNGLVAGIGLINTGTSSAIGINADYFYVGKPSNGKKPFMVLTSAQTIGGVTYPAGTWIDVALIASATIGTAHIANAAITTAKIADLAVTNAKINDLNAAKITAGTLDANRIAAGSITVDKLNVNVFTSTAADGSKSTIVGGTFKAYYPNNNLAVFLGVE